MFQLIYLRFTQPRADPAVLPRWNHAPRRYSPTARQAPTWCSTRQSPRRRRRTIRGGGRRRRRPSISGISTRRWLLQGALRRRERLHLRLRRQLHAGDDQAACRALPRLPAGDARSETLRDLGITPPPGVVEKTIEKGIAPKSQVAIVLSGPIEYDQPHLMAFRTVTLLLQSRLLDTIRQELGGTYAITRHSRRRQVSASALHGADRLDLRPGAHRGADGARPRRDRRRQGGAVV